jgi:hypothetical protein
MEYLSHDTRLSGISIFKDAIYTSLLGQKL